MSSKSRVVRAGGPMTQSGEITARHIWLAVFLSLLEVILFVVGRALESTYGFISGALVIFVLNLSFLLSTRLVN